jgi:hypothetical protein
VEPVAVKFRTLDPLLKIDSGCTGTVEIPVTDWKVRPDCEMAICGPAELMVNVAGMIICWVPADTVIAAV